MSELIRTILRNKNIYLSTHGVEPAYVYMNRSALNDYSKSTGITMFHMIKEEIHELCGLEIIELPGVHPDAKNLSVVGFLK